MRSPSKISKAERRNIWGAYGVILGIGGLVLGGATALGLGFDHVSRDHCLPWEKVYRSDVTLAEDAINCAVLDGNFSGAESNVRAIGDVSVRSHATLVVDYSEAAAALRAVGDGNTDALHDDIRLIETDSIKKQVRVAVRQYRVNPDFDITTLEQNFASHVS